MADLQSPRFAGISVLEACLDGTHRMMTPETGVAVQRVQQALIDLGFPIPSGATGNFMGETSAAVVQYKREHSLHPDDPVVGPGTMAALDEDMVAFDNNLQVPIPPPPPPPSVPPPDPFGRRPAGLARLPAALGTVAVFAGRSGTGAWPKLDRATVASSTASLCTTPDLAQQGGNGLCTTAAFANVWAQDAPDAYAAFATALFENGAADLAPSQGAGGMRITASNDLRNADYAAIAANMGKRGYPVPSQADWMVFSAIRDSSNLLIDFTGDPDDWVSKTLGDGSTPAELATWLHAAGAWTSVVPQPVPFLTAPIDAATSLDPSRSRVILSINAAMITSVSGGHSVVLRSPVVRSGDNVDLTIWTWAALRRVTVPVAKFNANYRGATVAFL